MAKDDERPQFNPKHRIAGAIILVSLAVIFLPMLLDESAPPKETRTLTDIPERDAPVSETKVVITPVPAPGSAKTQTAAADPVAEKPASEAPAPTSLKTETVKTDTAKTEPKKAESKVGAVAAVDKKSDTAAKAKPVAVKGGVDVAEKISKGWIVQVGTFSNNENADRLRDKLKGQGFAVSAENVTVNGGKAVRLRVGPFRDKSAANKAQTQLQKELNIQGIVLAYP
jgi:DedD protein